MVSAVAAVKRVQCAPRNYSDTLPPVVRLLNSSDLLHHLGASGSPPEHHQGGPARGGGVNASVPVLVAQPGRCTVVLFYASWCRFSAQMAPHYNALARAFPSLDVVAIDAYHFSQ